MIPEGFKREGLTGIRDNAQSLGLNSGQIKGSFAQMGNVNWKVCQEFKDTEHLRNAHFFGKHKCIP